jgi:broad specificity phosphatase PhoE
MLISHDAVNREILVALDPDLGEPDQLPQANGCFNTLEYENGQWIVREVNKSP